MKELLVVSGKGGTGKTTVAAALAVLAQDKVIADCDVDAADLHLLLKPVLTKQDKFFGLGKASVDPEKCTGCGFCFEVCRYDAVFWEDRTTRIRAELCEGCGVCFRCCPSAAIQMVPKVAGHVMESETRYGVLIHASLGVGEDNSGRLVAEVRKRSTKIAEDQGVKQVIVDGPPGIGCPVISSISGVDLALVVTEPTVAGRHDLARILGLLSHFRVPAVVCINKFDLDAPNSDEIMRYCREKAVAVVGRIPFDEDVPRSLSHGRPLISSADREQKRENAPVEGPAARELRCMWERLQELL